MRFDLEIPTTNNVKLTFIREGFNIPTTAIPLIYHKDASLDMFPSDFLSAEVGYYPREFLSGGYEKTSGPEIKNPKSDTFIITDIVKYSQLDGTAMPLFYKHTIGEAISDDAIKVVDFFGAIINKDLYIIDSKEDITYIYINKQDKILFVEYVSNFTSVKKELLDLIPVYEEATWGDVLNKKLGDRKYIYLNNIISVNYDKEVYIAYLSDTKLYRPPYGNLDDQWHIGVLNSSFMIGKNKYWVPEFYLQDLDTDYRYKKVSNKKCLKLVGKYIKTQYPIAKHARDSLFVYVYDYYTKNLKYAFSSDESLAGAEYKDSILYTNISNFNSDGVIELPIELTDLDIVYASHYTDEYYYEYKGINIKNILNSNIDYVAIFIKPNILDTERSISHALIGYNSSDENVFKTIEEYQAYIELNKFYNVAIITSINPYNVNDNNEYYELDITGNIIIDKLNACKAHVDVLYKDIINGDVIFPTNDVAVAHVNISNLVTDGILKYNLKNNLVDFDDFSKAYLKKVNDTILKNLDASSFSIIEFNFNRGAQQWL